MLEAVGYVLHLEFESLADSLRFLRSGLPEGGFPLQASNLLLQVVDDTAGLACRRCMADRRPFCWSLIAEAWTRRGGGWRGRIVRVCGAIE